MDIPWDTPSGAGGFFPKQENDPATENLNGAYSKAVDSYVERYAIENGYLPNEHDGNDRVCGLAVKPEIK